MEDLKYLQTLTEEDLKKQYFVVLLKPKMLNFFIKQIFKDDIKLNNLVYCDLNIFKNSLLLTLQDIKLLAHYYKNTYFLIDLKKLLYMHNEQGLRKTIKSLVLKDLIVHNKTQEEKEFRVGSLVILKLDNKTYVIESIDLKKKEVIINSNINRSEDNDNPHEKGISLKVKLEHIENAKS